MSSILDVHSNRLEKEVAPITHSKTWLGHIIHMSTLSFTFGFGLHHCGTFHKECSASNEVHTPEFQRTNSLCVSSNLRSEMDFSFVNGGATSGNSNSFPTWITEKPWLHNDEHQRMSSRNHFKFILVITENFPSSRLHYTEYTVAILCGIRDQLDILQGIIIIIEVKLPASNTRIQD